MLFWCGSVFVRFFYGLQCTGKIFGKHLEKNLENISLEAGYKFLFFLSSEEEYFGLENSKAYPWLSV